MQKKKVIVIVIVLILAILGLAGAGIICFTDLFKSDKDLFYKYLLNKNSMTKIVEGISLEKNISSYKKKSEVEVVYEYDNSIEKFQDDQIIKNLEKNIKSFEDFKDVSAKVEANVDKENKNASYKIELNKLNNKVMDIEVVRNEDKYAIKSDDVLKKYIGIENSNIKSLAEKMELPMAEYLPEKLDYDSEKYKSLITIKEEEEKHIKKTYSDLLYKQIDANCYSKEDNIEIECANEKIIATKYTLSLNKEQSIDVAVKVLERLRVDSITLNLISNKIKTILPESEYTNIEKISETIQKYIVDLNSVEKNNDEYLKINVYQKSGITSKVEIIIENERKLTIDYKKENDEEMIIINQEFFKNESGAIVYDIKTSLSGANNIIIGRKGNVLSIEAELYDIKNIYKTILEETKEKYDEQNKENDNSKEKGINKIEEEDIKELEKIFNEYSDYENPELFKIGLKIEYSIDDNQKEKGIYLKICNSKLGFKIEKQEEDTTDIEEIEKLTDENCVILNSYSKSQIETLIELYIDKMMNIVKNKIKEIN